LTTYSTLKVSTDKEDNLISNYLILAANESIEKIFNSDGVKILERYYENSVLITVYKDFDSDGVFDTAYDYKDGLLMTVSFDENNNGVSEYIENYETGILSSWDFNEDGLIDSREIFKNGILYREISTKLDGVFDSTIEVISDDQ
jgi:antitoxin component YwqK of YwqJK toxin-antitoxin module